MHSEGWRVRIAVPMSRRCLWLSASISVMNVAVFPCSSPAHTRPHTHTCTRISIRRVFAYRVFLMPIQRSKIDIIV
eukprot:COSAG05_NODE_2319_length_3240_cov_3.126393_3_plen_76_part_00